MFVSSWHVVLAENPLNIKESPSIRNMLAYVNEDTSIGINHRAGSDSSALRGLTKFRHVYKTYYLVLGNNYRIDQKAHLHSFDNHYRVNSRHSDLEQQQYCPRAHTHVFILIIPLFTTYVILSYIILSS